MLRGRGVFQVLLIRLVGVRTCVREVGGVVAQADDKINGNSWYGFG
jgi:hypothetical protein